MENVGKNEEECAKERLIALISGIDDVNTLEYIAKYVELMQKRWGAN